MTELFDGRKLAGSCGVLRWIAILFECVDELDWCVYMLDEAFTIHGEGLYWRSEYSGGLVNGHELSLKMLLRLFLE